MNQFNTGNKNWPLIAFHWKSEDSKNHPREKRIWNISQWKPFYTFINFDHKNPFFVSHSIRNFVTTYNMKMISSEYIWWISQKCFCSFANTSQFCCKLFWSPHSEIKWIFKSPKSPDRTNYWYCWQRLFEKFQFPTKWMEYTTVNRASNKSHRNSHNRYLSLAGMWTVLNQQQTLRMFSRAVLVK